MVAHGGFSYHYSFRYRQFVVCNLDFLFTLIYNFRWVPSSLYTFLFLGFARDCHQINRKGSPNLTPFTQRVSNSGAQFHKSAASTKFGYAGIIINSKINLFHHLNKVSLARLPLALYDFYRIASLPIDQVGIGLQGGKLLSQLPNRGDNIIQCFWFWSNHINHTKFYKYNHSNETGN